MHLKLIRLGRRGMCLFASGNTPVTDCCEHGTEILVFTKYFYAYLVDRAL
jgi:hypothetical protein